jgi:hypothetical protein
VFSGSEGLIASGLDLRPQIASFSPRLARTLFVSLFLHSVRRLNRLESRARRAVLWCANRPPCSCGFLHSQGLWDVAERNVVRVRW